jgi:DNA-binding response OmpR family regulator
MNSGTSNRAPLSARIVLIDDDAAVRETLVRQLTSIDLGDGLPAIDAVATESIEAFLFELRRADTDLAIIDLKLDPGSPSLVKGKDLIRRVSESFACMIAVYTSEPESIDEPDCLEIGADDYIPKSANFWLLEARVKALLRRQRRHKKALGRTILSKGTVFTFGGWGFDLSKRELRSRSGEIVALTISEYELLQHLLTTEGNYVTFDAFASSVIERAGERADRRLDNIVYRLRKKLGADFPLVSLRGGGYELRGIVTH